MEEEEGMEEEGMEEGEGGSGRKEEGAEEKGGEEEAEEASVLRHQSPADLYTNIPGVRSHSQLIAAMQGDSARLAEHVVLTPGRSKETFWQHDSLASLLHVQP